jgi:CTP synthase (UTP-ammonia lyase)
MVYKMVYKIVYKEVYKMVDKKNKAIYCTEEERAWLKEVLEKKRSGDALGVPVSVTIGIQNSIQNSIQNGEQFDSTSIVNSITMAKQEILEAIKSISTIKLNSASSYIRTALIIYFYEKRKRETPGWTKGSVDSWANWCIKQDPEIGNIVNQVLGDCPKEKPRKNPFLDRDRD